MRGTLHRLLALGATTATSGKRGFASGAIGADPGSSGFAWAPGAKNGRQKTVVRGGFGMFYTRFDDNYTLQTLRFNGVNQAQYILVNPDFYPRVPTIAELSAARQSQTIREKDADLRAPYILQSAISIERQLPANSVASLTFTDSRANHLFRSVVLSSPLGLSTPEALPGDRIYEYQSTGILRQNQMIASFRTSIKKVSLNSFYMFNHAHSDTDGAGSFPASTTDFRSEYGRSSLDVRHRFVLSFTAESEGVTADDVVQRLLESTPTREDELSRDDRFQKIFAS